MKVLIALDDSLYSETVVSQICKRRWPADTQFRIISVLEPLPPSPAQCANETMTTQLAINKERRSHLEELAALAKEQIEKAVPRCQVYFEIESGNPADEIIRSAVQWEADRILIGAHGQRVCSHNLSGSVSRKVANHALCTVEIIQDMPSKSERRAV